MSKSRSDEYREDAEQCEQEAKCATHTAVAYQYLELAKHWRRLVERMDDHRFPG